LTLRQDDITKGSNMSTNHHARWHQKYTWPKNQDARTQTTWQSGFNFVFDATPPTETAWIERLAAALANCDDGQREALVRGFWSGIEESEDEVAIGLDEGGEG